jgi:transcriptional regulator with XRE-family HTH domain
MQRFGEKLHALRMYHGMSVRELAKALDYAGHSYIGDVMNGKRRPSADFVLRVAVFFGVSLDALMRDDWELDLSASQRNPADTDETT